MLFWTIFSLLAGATLGSFCSWLLANPGSYRACNQRIHERDAWFLARCHMLVRRENLKLFVVILLWATFLFFLLAVTMGMRTPLSTVTCVENTHRHCLSFITGFSYGV
jgi:uncharacterized membrane protein YdjX (TVP38/TMEM64 family)